jgi:hypothetical protein
MSSKTATITVNNDAQFPIVDLAVIHWQEDGIYKDEAPVPTLFQCENGKLPPLTFDVTYDDDHENYWAVAWHNMHDPALYYLVTNPTFWQKFARDVMTTLDDAIGDAIDVCTESPAGSAWASAANTAVQAIYDTAGGDAKIKNDIHTSLDTLDIYLKCDRKSYELKSDHHTTECSAQIYYPKDLCPNNS